MHRRFVLAIVQILLIACASGRAGAVEFSAGIADPGQIAAAFARSYFRYWSQSSDSALAYLGAAYAPIIEFYGKPIARSKLIDEKRRYAERWPFRLYTLEPGTLRVQCADYDIPSKCSVSGVVHWDCRSEARNALSTGAAEFALNLSIGYRSVLIVGEGGRVLSRNVQPLTPDAGSGSGAKASRPDRGEAASGGKPVADPGSPGFQRGLADRTAWEQWFDGLSGDYRLGALYWAGERSKSRPGSCYGSLGQSLGAWTAGCLAARQRLAYSDGRRRVDAQYWFGWNAYASEAEPGRQSAAQVAPAPAAPEGANPQPSFALPDLLSPEPGKPGGDPRRRTERRVKHLPLKQMLAKCDQAARGVGQLTLPGLHGDVVLNRCYRGRDHLACTVDALVSEAQWLNEDYEDLINSNYPDLRDIDALCRIDPKTLAEQEAKAKLFDDRREAQKRAFDSEVDCMASIRDALPNVRLPDLNSQDNILQSLLAAVRSDIDHVAAAQKEVLALADKIDKSRKAMATIEKVHKAICRREPVSETRR